MSIYTNWDPLEEVIVGNCNTKSKLPGKAGYLLDIILEETKEDLDNIASYLEKLNVKVYRPVVQDLPATVDLGDFKILNPTQPIVPRDQYFVYDKTIYQTYTSMPDRYADAYSYYNIFAELFSKGYNWLSQPPPMIKNFTEGDNRWYTAGKRIYGSELADKILWHTATMFKCGDTLITNTLGPGTQLGLEWMRKNVSANIVENYGTHAENFGHIDHGYYMVNDDTVVCVEEQWVPEILRTKNIINVDGLYEPFDYETYLNSNTRHGIDKSSVEWLEKWFSEWKGYSQQVVFEANVLVVDPHNVMFSTYQPKVFELLDKHGITCHVCKVRHGLFWEAGVHCLTLDVKRSGNQRKIV